MKGLSLILPAHNAERVIKDSIEKYHKTFSKKFKDFEIIVVCNNCTDRTESICHSLESRFPLQIISVPYKGKGNALMKGFNRARFDIIGFLDADNPFDLNKISKMINYLDNNHAVIVSKYKKGRKKKQEFLSRRFISLGGSLFSKTLLGLPFRDTQAGAKFFKKEVWEKMKKDSFICVGFDWDMEFLYKLKKLNFKVVEVYVPCKSEKFSSFRVKYLPGMVFRLIKLRFL